MTIANTTRKTGPYAGNGVTTTFAISFDFFSDDSNVRVTKKQTALDTDNGTILVNPTDFSVSGSNVVMVAAPATGYEILIELILPETQSYDYIPGGVFPQSDHETNLDRITRLIQQLSQKIARAPLVSVFSAYTGLTLPTPVSGYVLSWKSDLTGVENVVTTADILSAQAYAAAAANSASVAAGAATTAGASATAAAVSAAAAAVSAAAVAASAGTAWQETIVGVYAAGDTTYTMAHTPTAAAALLAILGMSPQTNIGLGGVDYSLSANVVTFTGQDTTASNLTVFGRY